MASALRAFDPKPQRWLFVFPHPDDELSIAAWLRRLARSESETFAIWVHATARREAESRRVAESLGLAADRLYFLGGEDKRLARQMATLTPQIARIVNHVRPDRVATAAFEQGHLDHDATNFMANMAFAGPIFEFPLYHTYLTPAPFMGRFADPHGEEVLDLDPEESRLKRQLSWAYPSQRIAMNLILHEARELILGRRPQLAYHERMRLQVHLDFRRPNLPPRLARRVEQSRRWQAWLRALDEYAAASSGPSE